MIMKTFNLNLGEAEMRRIKTIGPVFGFVFLSSIFCVLSLITSGQQVEAEVLDFDFTYTSQDTIKEGLLGDTIRFHSRLTNTGTEADSYFISMTENPPTPIQWWIWFCSGGVCHDTTVTLDTVYLPVGEWDDIFLDISPQEISGEAKVTIAVTSQGNSGLSKSITFLLAVRPDIPVTGRWGLMILISLLFASGLYLILKKLRPIRTSSS